MFGSATRRGAAVCALSLTAGLAACGGGSDDSGSGSGGGGTAAGGKIAFLLPENKTTRYEQQDRPDFINKVKQLCPGCQVLYSNAEQDPAKQQQQAEQAITNGAKVLVIDAVDVKSAASIVNRAAQSHIPVVSYGRLVANSPVDYYVSIDPYEVGQQQGRALVAALKKSGHPTGPVVMINGSPTDSNSAPYKNGAHDVIDAAGVKVAKEFDTPDWSPDKAQTEMDQSITALGKNGFAGVYVANDGMAAGVVASLKGANVDPKSVPITGQDAQVDGVQRILAGQQLMTVYQPIRKIADAAAELAVPLAQGKTPPHIATALTENGSKKVPSVLVDTVVVTKDNAKQTVFADGFVKPADVCVGPYKSACSQAGIG
jgi:D-xylose transport system substrate-binding protein